MNKAADFSAALFFAYCISNFEHHRYIKIAPEHQKTMFRGLFFDHMFDHLQNRSTWRQECQRARFDNFCVLERSKRSRNVQKMVIFTIGVIQATSTSYIKTSPGANSTSGLVLRGATMRVHQIPSAESGSLHFLTKQSYYDTHMIFQKRMDTMLHFALSEHNLSKALVATNASMLFRLLSPRRLMLLSARRQTRRPTPRAKTHLPRYGR